MANTRDVMGEQACLDALVAVTLTSFEDDGVTKVGQSGLRYQTALTDVKLSQCRGVDSYAMSECLNLVVVDMLGTGAIYSYAFYNDSKLAHLIMRGSTKTTLSGLGFFDGTPIISGNGAIYVDESVLSAYKSDSQWSNYFVTTLDKYPLSVFETIEDDWATIIAKAEAGTASQSYSIGDTKIVDLGSEGKVQFQVAAFNADPLASDPTKTAGITFISKQILSNDHRMNPSNNSGAQGTGANGGWEYSEMRTYLSGTIMPKFPSALQTGIKEVTKYSDYIVPGESAITHDQATTDKLWIPSAHEVFPTNVSVEQTGPTYDLFSSSNNRNNKYHAGSMYTSNWWLRSAYSVSDFRYINNGTLSNSGPTTARGICLGFCI